MARSKDAVRRYAHDAATEAATEAAREVAEDTIAGAVETATETIVHAAEEAAAKAVDDAVEVIKSDVSAHITRALDELKTEVNTSMRASTNDFMKQNASSMAVNMEQLKQLSRHELELSREQLKLIVKDEVNGGLDGVTADMAQLRDRMELASANLVRSAKKREARSRSPSPIKASIDEGPAIQLAPRVKTIGEALKDEADAAMKAKLATDPTYIECMPPIGSILDSLGPRGEEIRVNGVALR